MLGKKTIENVYKEIFKHDHNQPLTEFSEEQKDIYYSLKHRPNEKKKPFIKKLLMHLSYLAISVILAATVYFV